MKPLLVGEANPYQDNEEDGQRYAFYPEPAYSAGGRLCRMMNLSERDYLRRFDRVNLCHGKFDLAAAQKRASRLVAERGAIDIIIACGSKVARAFGVTFEPFEVYVDEWVLGPSLIVLPHPSGRNRFWQKPGTVERMRVVLYDVGILEK